jgi:glucan phosphoethanolaminetransferase (alkaline phosphatase superfamily)
VRIQRTQRPSPGATTWLLALLIPAAAAVAVWFWSDLTISARSCQTGTAGEGVASAGLFLLVLVLAGPIAVAWQARRSRPIVSRLVAPLFVSFVVSIVVVLIALQLWWYQHNCYT